MFKQWLLSAFSNYSTGILGIMVNYECCNGVHMQGNMLLCFFLHLNVITFCNRPQTNFLRVLKHGNYEYGRVVSHTWT